MIQCRCLTGSIEDSERLGVTQQWIYTGVDLFGDYFFSDAFGIVLLL